MPHIRRPGATLYFHFDRTDDAPCLFFLNSLATDRSMWDRVVAHLGSDFSVLRFDARGHGKSTCETPDADIGLLVDDALAVMDAAGVEKACLVGLSLGGLTAQAIAARHPDRVSHCVLCATASAFRPPEMWIDRAELALQDGTAQFEQPSMQRWFTPAFQDKEPEAAANTVAMVGATSDLGYAACCRVLAGTDLTDEIGGIACPTLLVAGAADAGCPPEGHARMRDLIPGARLDLLDPAAHMLAVERPADLAIMIRDFVTSHAR